MRAAVNLAEGIGVLGNMYLSLNNDNNNNYNNNKGKFRPPYSLP
jgi:hypothetical protein